MADRILWAGSRGLDLVGLFWRRDFVLRTLGLDLVGSLEGFRTLSKSLFVFGVKGMFS